MDRHPWSWWGLCLLSPVNFGLAVVGRVPRGFGPGACRQPRPGSHRLISSFPLDPRHHSFHHDRLFCTSSVAAATVGPGTQAHCRLMQSLWYVCSCGCAGLFVFSTKPITDQAKMYDEDQCDSNGGVYLIARFRIRNPTSLRTLVWIFMGGGTIVFGTQRRSGGHKGGRVSAYHRDCEGIGARELKLIT